MSDFFEHEFGLKQLDCSQFKLSVAIKQFRSLKVSPYLLEDKKASLVTGSFTFNLTKIPKIL